MTAEVLKFDIQREGFPIEVAGVEFFFGTSAEELQKFFINQQEAEEKRLELENEIEQIESFGEIDEDDPEQVALLQENVSKALEISKKISKIDYDALLGEGAFEKIYDRFPYIDPLIVNFDSFSEAIANRILEETALRADKYNKKKAEALKKKAQKRKANKK